MRPIYGAAVLAITLLLAACGSAPPSPAQQVHSQMAKLGYKPHTIYQSRAAVVAAKLECQLLHAGHSYAAVLDAGVGAFSGDRAKATAALNTDITAYCPQYASAEQSHR